MIRLYQAIDSVKRRFGEGMVVRGVGMAIGNEQGAMGI
jgi:hypothetical protein